MLSSFAYYKQNIEILSKIAGINIIVTENKHISCKNSNCSKVIKLPATKEKTGYVFFCQCNLLYFYISFSNGIIMLEPLLIDKLNNVSQINSLFHHLEVYYLLNDILDIPHNEYIFSLSHRMHDYLNEGNKNLFNAELGDFLSAQISSYGKELHNVKSKLMELILAFTYNLKKNNSRQFTSDFKDIISKIYSAHEISELFDCINLFTEAFFTSKISQQTSDKEDIVAKASTYIEENYKENITLSDVAAKLFVSSTYLSRIFKDVTKESFINYLNSVRIKKSLYYLENTNMSIWTIAQNVGFPSSSYFAKIFKRINGVSPLKYRTDSERKTENVDM